MRVMRIADNMRNVAVTEGAKVEAQIPVLGWEVDAYPGNEAVEAVQAVSQADVDALVENITVNIPFSWKDGMRRSSARHVAVQAQMELWSGALP